MKLILFLSMFSMMTIAMIAQEKQAESFSQAAPSGGWDSFRAKLRFPDLPWRAGLEGASTVQFRIDSTGALPDSLVFDGPSQLFAWPLRRAIQSTKWIPAMQNGHPVSSFLSISVFFTLRDLKNHVRFTIDTTLMMIQQ